jgi:amidase
MTGAVRRRLTLGRWAKERKHFFFEKKKQKTFTNWTEQLRQSHANIQKFFGSFFQKRTFFLFCLATTAASPVSNLSDLSADLTAGRTTSAQLVALYLDRIEKIDRAGPTLRAVLAENPDALADAKALDEERRTTGARGALHGIPILVKDNIETLGPLPTTAGSLALLSNVSGRDAPVVSRLRIAGAVILGKTNLSEWANMRGSRAVSGWSGVGGLTRNPYALDRSACGSSSGSGAAVAAGLAAAAIGTETDGSITCPASVNGIGGFKPTLGLVSRTHIVPLAHSQDTAGPMARSVRDAAMLLTVMAGSDGLDAATLQADRHATDYTKALDNHALHGKRIGVMRFEAGFHPETDAVFAHALGVLRAAGATLVEIPHLQGIDAISDAETLVLTTELKADLHTYLATTPKTVASRSLADLIAFNLAHRDRELGLFGQELFDKAEATNGLDDPVYLAALATSRRLAGAEGIDRMLAADKLDALVAPTTGPAWVVDTVNGDHSSSQTSTLPAVAGYPHLSVPMGQVYGLPVGLSIIGPAWSDARVLAFGYAFEQALGLRMAPTFAPSLPAGGSLLEPVPGDHPAAPAAR